MKNKLFLNTLFSFLWLGFSTITHAQEKISPPPSVKLNYLIRADLHGLSLEGNGTIDWQFNSPKYRLQFDTRSPLIGLLLSERSEGTIESRNLLPTSFYSKRFRKDPITVNFDRQAGSIIFPGDTAALKLEGGEQDRISVLWQLLSMVRAVPARFNEGSPWKFFVIGHRGGESWTFTVDGKERLRTNLGEVDTLHLAHLPPEHSKAPKVDIWLAQSMDWLPVRIRFSEQNGDTIEQTLERIQKK
jgi:hypothetical protein